MRFGFTAANEIESQFARLPPAVQLSVLERLVHQMRECSPPGQDDWESGLRAMAADPEIRQEPGRITSEFSATESELCFQPRSLDPGRFSGRPAGNISGAILAKVENAVRHRLGL
jgi:hypothetical protein